MAMQPSFGGGGDDEELAGGWVVRPEEVATWSVVARWAKRLGWFVMRLMVDLAESSVELRFHHLFSQSQWLSSSSSWAWFVLSGRKAHGRLLSLCTAEKITLPRAE